MKMKFYKCKVCGKIVAIVNDTGNPTFCCGLPMEEMTPKTEEGTLDEKHVPIVLRDKNKVTVYIGEMPHPMSEEHYIEWIAIRTNMGNQRKCLLDKDEAKATFYLDENEKIITAYAYCNIHGLWKVDVCPCAITGECTCRK